MKSYILFFIILSLSFIISGCGDYNDLNEGNVVEDKEFDKAGEITPSDSENKIENSSSNLTSSSNFLNNYENRQRILQKSQNLNNPKLDENLPQTSNDLPQKDQPPKDASVPDSSSETKSYSSDKNQVSPLVLPRIVIKIESDSPVAPPSLVKNTDASKDILIHVKPNPVVQISQDSDTTNTNLVAQVLPQDSDTYDTTKTDLVVQVPQDSDTTKTDLVVQVSQDPDITKTDPVVQVASQDPDTTKEKSVNNPTQLPTSLPTNLLDNFLTKHYIAVESALRDDLQKENKINVLKKIDCQSENNLTEMKSILYFQYKLKKDKDNLHYTQCYNSKQNCICEILEIDKGNKKRVVSRKNDRNYCDRSYNKKLEQYLNNKNSQLSCKEHIVLEKITF